MATVTWKEITSRRARRTSAPVCSSTCFHRMPSSSSWMQIGIADRARLAARVVHHGVQVADLAQAVAAQFQRRGHEPETPLADVEGSPPVMVRRRVPVRHDHLRERHPVRDGPQPPAVGETDGVQHQSLAVVEAEPQLPVLPAQQPAVQGERHPAGWLTCSGLTSRRGRPVSLGRYSPRTSGRSARPRPQSSSSSSSSIRFRSTTGCRPVMWCAYGLPSALPRYHTSDQPIRRPRY